MSFFTNFQSEKFTSVWIFEKKDSIAEMGKKSIRDSKPDFGCPDHIHGAKLHFAKKANWKDMLFHLDHRKMKISDSTQKLQTEYFIAGSDIKAVLEHLHVLRNDFGPILDTCEVRELMTDYIPRSPTHIGNFRG
jgi:hypothetical protein